MIDRSFMRIAAMAVCLGGWSEASLAGTISDLICSARADTASVSRRLCSAGPKLDLSRGPGLCIGPTSRFRSRAAPFTAVTMLNPAHQNLCFKANSSVPLSHLALRAQQ
jgi:hypothetical protein